MRYSLQPTDKTFVKGYGYLTFAKNMDKNIGKHINKNFRGKCSHKLLDLVNKSAADALRNFLKRIIQKAAEATGDLSDNKIADKIAIVSRNSQQNNLETVTNEYDQEIARYIYLQEKDKKLLMI